MTQVSSFVLLWGILVDTTCFSPAVCVDRDVCEGYKEKVKYCTNIEENIFNILCETSFAVKQGK